MLCDSPTEVWLQLSPGNVSDLSTLRSETRVSAVAGAAPDTGTVVATRQERRSLRSTDTKDSFFVRMRVLYRRYVANDNSRPPVHQRHCIPFNHVMGVGAAGVPIVLWPIDRDLSPEANPF